MRQKMKWIVAYTESLWTPGPTQFRVLSDMVNNRCAVELETEDVETRGVDICISATNTNISIWMEPTVCQRVRAKSCAF